MKPKHTLILLVILIIFGALVFSLENPLKSRVSSTPTESPLLFPNLKPDEVVKIKIKTPEEETILEKKEGIWLVATMENFPAEVKAVENAFTKLEAMVKKDVVTSKAEKHAQFEVDSVKGVEVVLFDANNQELANFIIGKFGPDFNSTFIRLANSDEVILIPESVKSVFDRGKQSWRERLIYDLKADDIQRFEAVDGKTKFVFEKDENGEWLIKEPEVIKAQKSTVDSMVGTFAQLRTSEFPEQKKLSEYGLDKPAKYVTTVLNDGSSRTLYFGKVDEKGRYVYVKRDSNDYVFNTFESRLRTFFRTVEDFKEKPKPEGSATEEKPKIDLDNLNFSPPPGGMPGRPPVPPGKSSIPPGKQPAPPGKQPIPGKK